MRRIALALAAAAVLLPHAAQAQRAYGPAPVAAATPFTPAFPPGFEFDIAGGYLNAASREYVFVPETKAKLSELRWRDPAAYGVDMALAYRVVPWLTFRARGFVPVGSKDSKMKDFDWIPPYNIDGAFSHFSQHPKTELSSGYKIDLSLQGDFVQTDLYSLGLVGGFEKQQWRWKSTGGSYVYSENGFRDSVGTFPDKVGLVYRQGYDTPYLGLAGSVQFGDLKLSGRGIGSPYAMARGNDVHVLRDLNIKASFDPGWMAGGDLRAEYALSQNLAVVGTASYERIYLTKGRANYIDIPSGKYSPYANGGAGVEREQLMLTLGLSARM